LFNPKLLTRKRLALLVVLGSTCRKDVLFDFVTDIVILDIISKRGVSISSAPDRDVAYHAAMERVFAQGEGPRRMARKILAWILCAHRPLSTLELLHALAVEPGDTEVDEDNILETEQLLTICAGLVTIDEQSDSVRFIHYTTQEYLQRNQQTWLPHAKSEIARSCTAYLSIDGFAVGPCLSEDAYGHRLKEFALLDYAAVYWGPHVKLTMGSGYTSVSDEIATKALSLLLDNTRLSTISQVLLMSERERWSSAPVIEEGKGFWVFTG
jgi:hypothetical protein